MFFDNSNPPSPRSVFSQGLWLHPAAFSPLWLSPPPAHAARRTDISVGRWLHQELNGTHPAVTVARDQGRGEGLATIVCKHRHRATRPAWSGSLHLRPTCRSKTVGSFSSQLVPVGLRGFSGAEEASSSQGPPSNFRVRRIGTVFPREGGLAWNHLTILKHFDSMVQGKLRYSILSLTNTKWFYRLWILKILIWLWGEGFEKHVFVNILNKL